MKFLIRLCSLIFLLQINVVYAADILELQSRWANANYNTTGDEQVLAFETLIKDADHTLLDNPGNADLLIWTAIIKSTYAGKASGFSALGLVKSARESLEEALEINPLALDGSAYTSLGALYYQVPPWPIAFGSNKKARKLLKKALEINPDGIDANYFYGAFLVEEKEYEGARAALQKAARAPLRPGRPVADEGRRQEIKSLLSSIDGNA